MNKSGGLFIPADRIQRFQPTLPASVKSLADERDRKRGLNHTDKALNDLNKQIKKTGGGRQANQMAIRRRQIQPSNRHIASIAAY